MLPLPLCKQGVLLVELLDERPLTWALTWTRLDATRRADAADASCARPDKAEVCQAVSWVRPKHQRRHHFRGLYGWIYTFEVPWG
jgi:hypothetical protein